MREKTTTAIIVSPTLTREELQNKMGCPPEKADFFTISFDERVFTNRCPPELADAIVKTIKTDCLKRWRFENNGGLLYKKPLSKLATELGLTKIRIDPKRIPTWIEVKSPQDKYLAHDKRFSRFQQRLNRKGILIVALECNESTDQCEIPTVNEQLKSLHYRHEWIDKISKIVKKRKA